MHAVVAVNPVVPMIGRVLVGSLFLIIGLTKATGFAGAVGYFTKIGFPAPEFIAGLAMMIELVGGTLLIIGWRTRTVAWFLVLFMIIATFGGHRFWELDGGARAGQLAHFMKNVAVIGGLMLLAAFGPGRNSLDKR
jgi:putative oxidoreductase